MAGVIPLSAGRNVLDLSIISQNSFVLQKWLWAESYNILLTKLNTYLLANLHLKKPGARNLTVDDTRT